jgi:hypothetical protein
LLSAGNPPATANAPILGGGEKVASSARNAPQRLCNAPGRKKREK